MKITLLCFIITISFLTMVLAEDRLYISNINFNGNSFISDNELQNVIKLKSPKLFTRSVFTPKKLNRDKINLEAFYKSKGFLNIAVNANYTLESDTYTSIEFIINEGVQYILKDIQFSGNKLFSNHELQNFLETQVGNNFNPSKIRKQLKLLKNKYLNQGKIDVAIMDEINIEVQNVIARINIFEGNTYSINKIKISGLKAVKEKYVFRESLIEKGDIYNIDKIEETKRRIFDSGLFSSVEIKYTNIDKENGQVDIEIKVREYKSSSIEAKFGFKELTAFQENLTITGIDAQGRWILGNIFNTTSKMEFTGRIASSINLNIFTNDPLIERDFTIVYRTPWTFYFRIPTRIKYFHKEETEQNKLIRDGITYSLILNKDKTTKYEFNSTLEVIQSEDSLYTEQMKEPSRWMNLKYLTNKIQNPLSPSGGNYFSLTSTLYGTILGGERNFIKIESEYRKFYKIQNQSIIATRILIGYIKNLENDNILPQVYKFQLGGQTSLRGWASPDQFKNSKGALIMDMINLEYRFPIKNKIGGEIFFDCGRLYGTIYEFTNSSLNWNYGAGIVYHSDLGPIRLDFGFPFGNLSDPQLHASLLYMF